MVEPIMQYLICNVKKNRGFIALNRPNSLNALNLEMIRGLYETLKSWKKQAHVHEIIIFSQLNKAFCAGGDIRDIYNAYQTNANNMAYYFKEEYDLDRLIKHYPKPYTAILNGITMGGGLGISIHGSLRIALNNLTLAMPETGIGYFPDVGATFFLSRCPGEIGTYMGLTGARLNATEALYAGLVDEIIGEPPSRNILLEHRDIIDRCFQYTTAEEILAALLRETHVFAKEAHDIMLTKSPTSLKLTLLSLRKARNLDFDTCMQMEYRMACFCLENHDFFEGIRAQVIDKDRNPQWQPATLAEVDEQEFNSFI